jgi:hypothetical protein
VYVLPLLFAGSLIDGATLMASFYRKEVLPAAIQALQASGYRLVTVAECTGKEPYLKSDSPPLTPVSTFCSYFVHGIIE